MAKGDVNLEVVPTNEKDNDGGVDSGEVQTPYEKEDGFEYTTTEIGFKNHPGEITHWNLWKGAIAECFGTFMFLFFTLETVAATGGYQDGLGGGRHFLIANTFGFMIAILVYATAPISGGNLNPAVSVALALTKKISPLRAFVYIVFQCIGAILGCAVVKGVHEPSYTAMGGAINQVNVAAEYTVGGAFVSEMIGTMLLVFCVVSAVDANNNHSDRSNMKQSLGVLSIGLCVTMAHCALIPQTNCGINPARSFGASVVAGDFTDHWIFWVAPILGGIIAAFFYELVLKDRKNGPPTY